MDWAGIIQSNYQGLGAFFTEFFVSMWFLVILLAGIIVRRNTHRVLSWLCLAGLVGALVIALTRLDAGPGTVWFNGMVVQDGLTQFFRIFFIVATALVVLMSMRSYEIERLGAGEFYTLLMGMLLGMMFMASATNLLMMYLSIEMVSVSSYVMAATLKREPRSLEAGIKYVVYGAFSTGIMLMGMSYLYGIAGTLDLFAIREVLHGGVLDVEAVGGGLKLAFLLITVGMGFKVALVPFHFWCPDVYHGAPTPITALFSVAPKAAGFAVLVRFFFVATTSPDGSLTEGLVTLHVVNWPMVMSVLAMLTMTIGNVAAMGQTNIKRMLAYSSISHAGYLLIGFVVVNQEGLKAIVYYLVVYLLMNLGAFAIVVILGNKHRSEEIEDYRGLITRNPFLAVAMTFFLLSLAGLPPFAGFLGKFYLFKAAIDGGKYALAVVGVLNAVIALYYYAGVIRKMFLEDAITEEPVKSSPALAVLVVLTVVPTTILLLFGESMDRLATLSSNLLLTP